MTALQTLLPTKRRNVLKPPPLLEQGDRLSRDEFERRYNAMPNLKKAELIEGVVYMAAAVKVEKHGHEHNHLNVWLGIYESETGGTLAGDNSSLKLDLDNMPQPDCLLMRLPEFGGQADIVDGYIEGAPELIGEVSSSTVSFDLHAKLNVYRRNGVCEYVVWRTQDEEIDWFVLREGQFERLAPDADGILRSEQFPGLWLDAAAMTSGHLKRVIQVLQQGVASAEHAEFVSQLAKEKRS
ncbi:MAG: Uma2 family endonuclease [Planctomycetaceae bacterium]